MSGLVGNVKGTNTKVSTKDDLDRDNAIKDLKEIKRWDLRANTEKFKIDLLHNNRKGGCDVENGHYNGLYRDQDFYNFNKFTLPVPTANFPWRKEHFLNFRYQWISNNGYNMPYNSNDTEPDFEDNSFFRYTKNNYLEAFFVDYEIYKKIYKTGLPNTVSWGNSQDRGYWMTDGIGATDRYGNRIPEYWMCWELKDVEFWIKNNGIWVRDTTFDDPKVYKDFVDNYIIAREKYLSANKK